jgi:hypothetical protein
VISPRRCGLAILSALCWIGSAIAGAGELPPEHECPSSSGLRDAGPAEDAAPALVREGMVLAYADVLRLASLLPSEVLRHRQAFFSEGMRMEIGPCHRRYPQPRFYRLASEQFAGRPQLDADGNLAGYTAGLPFPPEAIDPGAADAGARWAWNVELRYRGAGPRGRFRIVDLPSRVGDVQTYRGSWFQLQTAHRADLAETDYRAGDPGPAAWIAGGRFAEPADARALAWRQMRPQGFAQRSSLPDDITVYVPSLRKVRRAASSWVDGLYAPRYRVTGSDRGGAIAVGDIGRGSGGAVAPGAAASVAVTENLARGFTGLSIRPNAYTWRLLGVREVLAPHNVARTGFPGDPDRNFGPSGLSVASDRWEVRQAVVIQGALREPGRDYDWLTLYVDTQTQQPLYVITQRRGGHLLEVGILLHRFSDDQPGYPAWPDGERASVFDPVAAVFYNAADQSGWRRESYDVVSTPLDEGELRRMTSDAYLERGH